MDYENHIKDQLTFLYGESSPVVWQELSEIIDRFHERTGGIHSERFDLSEKDVILITYGDQFQSPDQSHLKTLENSSRQVFQGFIHGDTDFANWVNKKRYGVGA